MYGSAAEPVLEVGEGFQNGSPQFITFFVDKIIKRSNIQSIQFVYLQTLFNSQLSFVYFLLHFKLQELIQKLLKIHSKQKRISLVKWNI